MDGQSEAGPRGLANGQVQKAQPKAGVPRATRRCMVIARSSASIPRNHGSRFRKSRRYSDLECSQNSSNGKAAPSSCDQGDSNPRGRVSCHSRGTQAVAVHLGAFDESQGASLLLRSGQQARRYFGSESAHFVFWIVNWAMKASTSAHSISDVLQSHPDHACAAERFFHLMRVGGPGHMPYPLALHFIFSVHGKPGIAAIVSYPLFEKSSPSAPSAGREDWIKPVILP